MSTMAPDVHIERRTVPVTRADLDLFTRAAAKAAPPGYRANRSAWMRSVALSVARSKDEIPRDLADAERIYEDWETQMPVTGTKAELAEIDVAAKGRKMPVATFLRAVARMRARELGVK